MIDLDRVEDVTDAILQELEDNRESRNLRGYTFRSELYVPSEINFHGNITDLHNAIIYVRNRVIEIRSKKEAYEKKLQQRRAEKEQQPVAVQQPVVVQPQVATDVNLDEIEITLGPYKIARGKQRDMIKIIWILKELNFFEKRENGEYATNRTDVITHFIDNDKLSVDNEISKALNTHSFMNVFADMQQKASELYNEKG